MRLLLPLLVLAACGFPRPANVGSDGGGDGSNPGGDGSAGGCTDCQLTALRPSIANTGQTVTLEGTFTDPVNVTFPGGVQAVATLLGPHRATVTVPPGATTGVLTVMSGGATTSLPFRRASFQLGLAHFGSFEEMDSARQMPTLVLARRGHCAVVVGPYVYVLGGEDASGNALNSIERALINADGTLQAFAQAGMLATARRFSTCKVIGSTLYVLGGLDMTGAIIGGVESASIMADGSLGTFAPVTGLALADPRQTATAEVIGSWLYVIGGADRNGSTQMIERAPIQPGGVLGAFAIYSQGLVTPRSFSTTQVIGNTLYALGGETNGNDLGDVEQSTIGPDGELGPFSTSTTSTLLCTRTQLDSAVLGDHLFIVGGRCPGIGADNIESTPIDATGAIGAFSTVDTWNTERWMAANVVVGNYLYSIGGQKYNPAEKTVERASLDGAPGLGTPTVQGATLANTTTYGCGFVIGKYAYILGGYTGANTVPSVQSAPIDADGSIGVYTFSTNPLAVARQEAACAIIGNWVYVIGGLDVNASPRLIGTIERAPINADGTLGAFAIYAGNQLVVPRAGHRALVLQDRLYVLGGTGLVSGAEVPQASAEVAQINSDGSIGAFQKFTTDPLTTPRINSIAARIGGWVYMIGGSDGTTALASIDSVALTQQGVLGGNLGPTNTQLAVPRHSFSGLMLGDQLYAIGGVNNQNFTVLSIEKVTMATTGFMGSFPSSPNGGSISTARNGHTSAITGNHVWHAGGANLSTPTNTIEQATLP